MTPQPDNVSNMPLHLIPPRLIELRGPSGKCYGELDVASGVIVFRRGPITERIDLTPYFKAATLKPDDTR